jgi:hypothetical protein
LEQILKVVTLYDILACLVPGLILVCAVHRSFQRRDNGYAGAGLWRLIIIAYVTGQLLQTVLSEQRLWLRQAVHLRPVERLFCKSPVFVQDKLIPALKGAFGDNSSEDWFYLAESYLQVRKLDAYTDIMHERYGFFRGLFLALTLSGISLISGELISRYTGTSNNSKSKRDILIATLCFAGASLSLTRMNDFDKYYGKAVYESFYAAYKLANATAASNDVFWSEIFTVASSFFLDTSGHNHRARSNLTKRASNRNHGGNFHGQEHLLPVSSRGPSRG